MDALRIKMERTTDQRCTLIGKFFLTECRLLLLLLSHFSCVRLCVTPEMAADQAPGPWDSPGKNAGVGEYRLAVPKLLYGC